MQKFGRYELNERIGIGGMAEVFRARSGGAEGVAKTLVIKKILPHLSEDDHFRTMFVNEAKIAVTLTHANIVQVFEFGKVDGQYFLAMEFVDGTDLRQVLKDLYKANSRIPLPYALYIASEVCKGLDYAHRKTDSKGESLGIIHRDVSPQNILISVEGEVKIADFGIAKAANIATETRSGAIKGKLSYLAPEHIARGVADRRSDIFALGVCLHEMLTGKPLFAGRGELEILKRIESGDYPRPSQVEPWLPKSVDDVVMKALERQPSDRYQTAAEFHEALGDIAFEAGARLEPTGLASFVRENFRKEKSTTEATNLVAEAAVPSANEAPGPGSPPPDTEGDPIAHAIIVHPEEAMTGLSAVSQPSASERIPQQPLAAPIAPDLPGDDISEKTSKMDVEEFEPIPADPPVAQASAGSRSNSDVVVRDVPQEELSQRSITIPPSRRTVSFVGRRPSQWVRYAVIGGVVVVFGGIGILAATGVLPVKTWVSSAMSKLGPQTTPTPISNRVDERLAAFRAQYGEVSGTSIELIKSAATDVQYDTIERFESAATSLEQALVLEPQNALAMAHLAETYAWLARYNHNRQLLTDALQFALRARALDPKLVDARRAQAAVLAVSGGTNPANAEEARKILETSVLPQRRDDPIALYLLGLTYAQSSPDKAEKVFKRVNELQRMHRVNYELGVLYRDNGEWRLAARYFGLVRRTYAIADLERGALLERMGRYRDAASAYADAASMDSQNRAITLDAVLRRAIINYQSLGNPRTAQAALEAELKTLDEVGDTELRDRTRIHLAHIYRQQRKYTKSAELARTVLSEPGHAAHPSANFALGMSQLRNKELDDAAHSFRSALSPSLSSRDKAEVLYYQAVVDARRGRIEEARALLDRSVRLDPHHWKAGVLHGLIAIEREHDDQLAVDTVVKLAKQDPLFADECHCFSDFVGDEADEPYGRAVEVFEKLARERRAYDATAWSALGIVRFHSGQRRQAWSDFDRAYSEDPTNQVARVFRAVRYELKGTPQDMTAAAKEYEAAKGSDFASAHLYTALGKIYMGQHRYGDAESNLVRALEKDSSYAPALYWQGQLYKARGKSSAAVANWRSALRSDPQYVPAAIAMYDGA